MSDSVFLDTNVLVYLFDGSEPTRQAEAGRRLQEELPRAELVVSTQVLQELFVALTRGARPICSRERAEEAVRATSGFRVVQVDTPLVFAAIRSSRDWQVSFWDALILESAASVGCDRVLSEDLSDGRRYGSVVVENPFSEARGAR